MLEVNLIIIFVKRVKHTKKFKNYWASTLNVLLTSLSSGSESIDITVGKGSQSESLHK